MNDPRKIVPIEELRRKAAERGATLDSLSEADLRVLTEELRRELGDLPDVRMDRVALAKARISKGFYTGERIAEGLLEAMRGPSPPEPIPLRAEDDVTEPLACDDEGSGPVVSTDDDVEEPTDR